MPYDEVSPAGAHDVAEWVVTTQEQPWRTQEPRAATRFAGQFDVMVLPEAKRQTIAGFGGCFNELGWTALQLLDERDRESILRDLFTPAGLNLSICRTPVGANDFSRDWYSYDETPDDLELRNFSIAQDHETLIPFIRAAQAHRPGLRLWASPWSPPTWMKTNGHFAASMPWPGSGVENGLRPDQVGVEGTDMFRVDDAHLAAYAEYFARYVAAYRAEGIRIETVMPQNEFNSAQVFPSCTWTPQGLSRFIAHLGPRMADLDVSVFLGTLERPDAGLVEAVLEDAAAGPWVRGAGLQWAGKGAIAALRHTRPELALYQTEQECGDGKNDWRFARHTWNLMKHFLGNGTQVYSYWNLALTEGGRSRWGWTQNSLVVVDPEARTARYTYDYLVLKHVAHHLQAGARLLESFSLSGFENQLAFANPDGSVVIVVQNDLSEPLTVRMAVGDHVVAPTLPADSFATLVLRPGLSARTEH
ncbi:glycoside hydrolase family 30 beta sandwich domain-containing protein [Cellulomonas sp. URHD0024]|uniref:glycoside hydrolase family 30 protein n=1 Tax=Cellulomonas sp. URHD0024 TaxID=1302620 RepID=UPI00042A0480|nr:glycoside hydrolase family 30 beta sandwich domain-containing protein [Cellulomonas sp. URHD0024]